MINLKILHSAYLLFIFGYIWDTTNGAAIDLDSNQMSKFLPYEDCGSKYEILELYISSCNTIPCKMTRGTTVNVNVIFSDEDNNTSFLKHEVRWIFNAIRSPAYVTPDPCGEQECITNDSEGKSYWATVFVDNTLPVITGTMQWEALNENDEDVLCFKVPVVVTI